MTKLFLSLFIFLFFRPTDDNGQKIQLPPNLNDTLALRQLNPFTAERNSINEINNNLSNFAVTTKTLEGYSTEGSLATFYTDDEKQLKKIKIIHYGETGKRENHFYYNQYEEVIAATTTLTSYNSHIIDPEFDEAKATVTNQTFYYPEEEPSKTGDNLAREGHELILEYY